MGYHFFFGQVVVRKPAEDEDPNDSNREFDLHIEESKGSCNFNGFSEPEQILGYAAFDFMTRVVESPTFQDQWMWMKTSGPKVYSIEHLLPTVKQLRLDADEIDRRCDLELPGMRQHWHADFLRWWAYWIERSVEQFGDYAALKIH